MALVIRLRQQGNRNAQTYRLVVMQKTAPRDGRYIDLLGWYNPTGKQDVSVNEEKVALWLEKGAQISEKAKLLVKRAAPKVLQEIAEKKRQKAKKAREKKKQKKNG